MFASVLEKNGLCENFFEHGLDEFLYACYTNRR